MKVFKVSKGECNNKVKSKVLLATISDNTQKVFTESDTDFVR